jgi:NADH-quinone oxidoreductase subunit J
MTIVFYISAFITVVATIAAITRMNPIHALLYFILSLLAVGVIFFSLGAPFAAALIVIINAGAIMVLFVFIIMMVNQGKHTMDQERQWTSLRLWLAPGFLAVILLTEIIYILIKTNQTAVGSEVITPKQVGTALFGPYLLAVELISILLLVGLLGAHHLARESHVVENIKEKGNNG